MAFSWFVGNVCLIVDDFMTDSYFLSEASVLESVLHDVCEVIEDGCLAFMGGNGR